ncbi:hypothetical protein KY289_027911 [Solanum tuberosum]|nr:hypothetical protein KY289_027911 [Solanum tuberosum]
MLLTLYKEQLQYLVDLVETPTTSYYFGTSIENYVDYNIEEVMYDANTNCKKATNEGSDNVTTNCKKATRQTTK